LTRSVIHLLAILAGLALRPVPSINANERIFMTDKPIEEKVKDIIVEQLGVNPEQVTLPRLC
jgi:hypothetical protein